MSRKIFLVISFTVIFLVTSVSFYQVSLIVVPDNNERFIDVLIQRMTMYDDWLLNNFSYFSFRTPSEKPSLWIMSTAYYLIGLKALVKYFPDVLRGVRLNEVIDWLINQLEKNNWRVTKPYGISPEKYVISNASYFLFLTIRALSLWGAVDRINRTAVIEYVLDRYNETVGGFREIPPPNKTYAPLWFPGLTDGGYYSELIAFYRFFTMPNLLSTSLALGILYYLDALDMINVSKVIEFILACKTEKGFFKPSPYGKPGETYPIDVNGTLVPYIYAGVMSLYYLDRLDLLNDTERENIGEYFIYLGISMDGKMLPGKYITWNREFAFSRAVINLELNTLNVIETMGILGLAKEYESWLKKLALRFIYNPFSPAIHVPYTSAFPIPQPNDHYTYGEGTGHQAIAPIPAYMLHCFDAAGIFNVLYTLTPRAVQCRENFEILAIITGLLAVAIAQVIRVVWRKLRKS
ncbi:MAG: prenyltransferase/squalene oxidase repeat-containing protein [Candidatus Njordarchaeales archaeon]